MCDEDIKLIRLAFASGLAQSMGVMWACCAIPGITEEELRTFMTEHQEEIYGQ